MLAHLIRDDEMKASALALIAVTLLSGCTQVPLTKETQSGYPEGVFRSTTVDDAKSKVLSGCAAKGLVIEDTNGSQVICSKETSGMSAVATQLAIGNSYSTTPQAKVRFVFIPQGTDVKVIAYPWVETMMPGGQVNKMEAKGNVDRNALQTFMTSVGAE
ncbi:hypothetical protein [Pseudomonas pseudonitroreducens]|uniref:hypothetical protein n=1 Tax=Pseudomonas pseudonitroreducens TaxID=2892326 RepID=UPI001F1C70FD|nr:hypothetical protein [Pseudomonas pseudonitroreducens]